MLRLRQLSVPFTAQQFLGLLFQIFEVWLFRQLTRHDSSFYGPGSATTGRREVNARCSETGSGGIIPFRGREATWFAASTLSNPSELGEPSASACAGQVSKPRAFTSECEL